MNLINKQVTHKTYGKGNVVEFSDSFVEIKFRSGHKKFVFPDAFGKHLILSDQNIAESIKRLKEKQARENRVAEIAEAQERAVRLEEQQLRMRTESLLKNLKIHPSAQAVFWIQKEDKERVFEEWTVFTGRIKSGEKKGTANRPARLHQNSTCLLTTRDARTPEKNRLIIGAFMVNTEFVGKLCQDGIIPAHEDFRIQLTEEEADRMKFWNYYINEKNPKNMTWNTGIYRYFDNILMAQILKDILDMRKDTPGEDAVEAFLDHFCKINRIDKTTIPKAGGALVCI